MIKTKKQAFRQFTRCISACVLCFLIPGTGSRPLMAAVIPPSQIYFTADSSSRSGSLVRTKRDSMSAIQRLDDRILLNAMEKRTEARTSMFLLLSKTNNYVNYAVPVGLLATGIFNHDREMRQNALYVASSSAVTFLVTNLIKITVRRPRPFVRNIKIVPVYRAGGYSFPSGHASSSFTTATSLTRVFPKWYVAVPSYLWASAVSYSRIYLGVHHPSDVAAGAVLGAGAALSLQSLKK